jgi:hypothetical protein
MTSDDRQGADGPQPVFETPGAQFAPAYDSASGVPRASTPPPRPPSGPPPAMASGDVSLPPDSSGPFAEGDTGEDGWTEATRLMCAAAYLEDTFAQDVLDEILHERHRAVHIPTGVDIGAVAKHCLAACRQKVVRDLLLTADVLLSIIVLVVKHDFKLLVLGFLLAWLIVFWDKCYATYLIVVKRLSPASFSSGVAPAVTDPHLAKRIEELARDQRGNLTVYSGFLPFSGAGLQVGGWSFLVDLTRAKEEAFGETSTVQEPTLGELYDATARALGALAMTNMEIRDRLFVSGSDIREDRALMPNPLGPPVAWVSLDVLSNYMSAPTHRIRHYRCIEVVDWRGELVVSLFLRFAISNGRLFCELNKFVLLPLKEELHRLNHLGGRVRIRDLAGMFVQSGLSTPGLSLRAAKVILRPFGEIFRESSDAKHVQNDEFFDFGAAITAIDRVRSRNYRRYFQRLDKEMYDKVLERTVLDSIAETLDEHGIDPSEIDERRASITNINTMITGGNVGTLAVGRGNRIFNLPGRGGDAGGAPPTPTKA